jgi:hypothetical protein
MGELDEGRGRQQRVGGARVAHEDEHRARAHLLAAGDAENVSVMLDPIAEAPPRLATLWPGGDAGGYVA